MPRKTEIIHTEYQGVDKDGEVVKESKSRNTVARYMRHHPDGEILERNLVGYYTPWVKSEADKPKEDTE